ncbi:hypothetical protein DRQ33_04205 [bacterium]|nr:MAG: hypothetical protein DRQ33_04205 [bacterium]
MWHNEKTENNNDSQHLFHTTTVFPNPFNLSCVITTQAGAEIEIHDLQGNMVTTPFGADAPLSHLSRGTDQSVSDGQGVYIWTPNETIPSGIHLVKRLCRIVGTRTGNGYIAERKILLAR